MPDDFKMPKFDRTKTLDGNYAEMLMALGFLSEDVPGVTVRTAESELAQKMPSFVVGPYAIKVEAVKFKTAAFFLGLALKKQSNQFELEPEDIFAFCDYMTEAVIADARANPGEHPTIDFIRSGASQIMVMTNINVA
jgi:hypothetical protein